MENSSLSTISPGSPRSYAPDSFRALPSAFVLFGLVAIIIVIFVAGAAAFMLAAHVVTITPYGTAIDRRALARDAVPFSLALQLLIDVFVAIYLLAAIPAFERTNLRAVGFGSLDGTQLLVAVIGAAAMVAVVDGLGSAINSMLHTNHEQQAVRLLLSAHGRMLRAMVAALAIVVAPVAEELTFRVFVFNAVGRYGGFWLGAVASGILFAAAHADKYAFIPLVFGGIILCGVYARTRNAYASMITHGLFNTVSVLALYFAPQLAK